MNKAPFPKKLDPKDSANPSPHVLKTTQRGFRPPYRFKMFADRLFALRATMHREEWWKEHASHNPRPQLPLKENPSSADLIAYNQDQDPVHGPGSEWGKRHFVEQQEAQGVAGWKQLRQLGRAWKYLGTEDNRARAIVLLDDAFAEARQKKTRGAGYWKKTKGDQKHKRKALQDARAAVEKRGTAFISALDDYLAATTAIAPYAREQLLFVTSPGGLWQAVTAEFENPGEIAVCIKELRGVMARLYSINDYDAATKGKGQRGPEESKAMNMAIRELDRLFQEKLPTLYQAEQYIHHLLYAAGIWPNPEQKSLTGKIHRLRNQRRLSAP